ncbi:D-alanine--D-alanine ligase family protein [Azospirillum argentinense]|uniref:hypothetical protein n=1 Tax=Azospirillum argentinense TaxID=2970906 RepID=UPI0009DCB619|nr:hypothetical protein [Azospirillum argentinense]
MSRIWDGRLVIVADPLPDIMPTFTFDRSIDQPTQRVVEELLAVARKFCRETVLLNSPAELSYRYREFTDSLIFPYWFGRKQRSRHAYVPGLCEACGLMFVGADAFTKTVCNDKELSKAVCRLSGLSVPSSIVVNSREDLELCCALDFPVFAKPNFEGTSLGITERNVCATLAEVEVIFSQIQRELGQPVIVEEYIDGIEFSAAFLVGRDRILHGASCWMLDGKPFGGVYDWRLKRGEQLTPGLFEVSRSDFWDRAKKALSYFEKTGLFRIDCRVRDGEPVVIELTPDIYLGADGEFVSALSNAGGTYPDVIGIIIRDSLEWYGAEMPVGD